MSEKAKLSKPSSKKAAKPTPIDKPRPALRTLERHIGLLSNLSQNTVLESGEVRPLLRAVAKDIDSTWSRRRFRMNEMAWVLRVAFEHFSAYRSSHNDRAKLYELEHLGAPELGPTPEDPHQKLLNVGIYLKRLSAEDLFLVLCHVREGVPLSVLASVLGKPEDSLVVQLAQAYDAVETWIWKDRVSEVEKIANAIREMKTVPLQGISPLQLLQPVLTEPSTLRSRWRRSPWWFRNLMETFGVAMLVIAVLALVPKLRRTYESSLQKRLQAFDLQEVAAQSTSGVPFQVPVPGEEELDASEESLETEEQETSSAGQSTQPGVTLPSAPVIKAGANEIWRFSMRTETLKETRPKIQRLLEESGIPKGSADLRGLEAPGGVLYNLAIDQSKVPDLMEGLENMTRSGAVSGALPRESGFTWFKNSSLKPVPHGKTRVVIWISQL